LKVDNLIGKEVAVLVDEVRSAGNHACSFNASGLPSGFYMYMLRAGASSETGRMVVIKRWIGYRSGQRGSFDFYSVFPLRGAECSLFTPQFHDAVYFTVLPGNLGLL
jgi:hypothetical protein